MQEGKFISINAASIHSVFWSLNCLICFYFNLGILIMLVRSFFSTESNFFHKGKIKKGRKIDQVLYAWLWYYRNCSVLIQGLLFNNLNLFYHNYCYTETTQRGETYTVHTVHLVIQVLMSNHLLRTVEVWIMVILNSWTEFRSRQWKNINWHNALHKCIRVLLFQFSLLKCNIHLR